MTRNYFFDCMKSKINDVEYCFIQILQCKMFDFSTRFQIISITL